MNNNRFLIADSEELPRLRRESQLFIAAFNNYLSDMVRDMAKKLFTQVKRTLNFNTRIGCKNVEFSFNKYLKTVRAFRFRKPLLSTRVSALL